MMELCNAYSKNHCDRDTGIGIHNSERDSPLRGIRDPGDMVYVGYGPSVMGIDKEVVPDSGKKLTA